MLYEREEQVDDNNNQCTKPATKEFSEELSVALFFSSLFNFVKIITNTVFSNQKTQVQFTHGSEKKNLRAKNSKNKKSNMENSIVLELLFVFFFFAIF